MTCEKCTSRLSSAPYHHFSHEDVENTNQFLFGNLFQYQEILTKNSAPQGNDIKGFRCLKTKLEANKTTKAYSFIIDLLTGYED